jgi:hypothetical protein
VILFSHFGPAREVDHLTALAIRRLQKWTAVVEDAMRQTDELVEVVSRLRQATASELRAAEASPTGQPAEGLEDRYELLSSYEMNALGLIRYLTKRAESEAPG